MALRKADREANLKKARDPSTSPQELVILAEENLKEIKFAISENPHAPPELLARYARDNYGPVRYRVALNPSTPPEVLALLAKDRDRSISLTVLDHPSTPSDVLVEHALGKDSDAFEAVLSNPALSQDLFLQILSFEGKTTKILELPKRESQFVTDQMILSALNAQPTTLRHIINTLSITDLYEARYLKKRLRTLRSHNIITIQLIENKLAYFIEP